MATRIKGFTSRMSAAGGGLDVTTGVLEGGRASLGDMDRPLDGLLIELAEHGGEVAIVVLYKLHHELTVHSGPPAGDARIISAEAGIRSSRSMRTGTRPMLVTGVIGQDGRSVPVHMPGTEP